MSIWAHRNLERINLHFLFIHLQTCATEGYTLHARKEESITEISLH